MASRVKENLIGFTLIGPFCAFFAIFLLGPFFYAFWLSLHSVNIYSDWYNMLGSMDFVGLKNYRDLIFHDVEFWWSVIMTGYYALLTIPTSIALALLLAILLNSKVKFKGLFRTGFFLPQVLDLLVIGIIWMLLFNPNTGAIDKVIQNLVGWLSPGGRTILVLACGLLLSAGLAYLINMWIQTKLSAAGGVRSDLVSPLTWLALTFVIGLGMFWLTTRFDQLVVQPYFGGAGQARVGLLENKWTIMPVIGAVVVLKGVGLGMILFLTTIQQIPTSVYEAAEVDGANARQRAFLITLPLVKPIVLFLSITGLMATLNAFTEIYAMTFDRGGPPVDIWGETVRSAKLTGYYLWVNFREYTYGKAAAISFLLMILALFVSLVNVTVLRERD